MIVSSRRVEAQVVAVLGGRGAGLQVDDDLARLVAARRAEGEVDLALQSDEAAEEVHPDGALGDRSPLRLEGREALEKLADEVDGLAPQLGAWRLADAGQPEPDRRVVLDEDGERFVDHGAGRRLTPPVHGQLDRLVGHRTPRLYASTTRSWRWCRGTASRTCGSRRGRAC